MTNVHHVAARNTSELLEALPPLARHGRAVPYVYGGERRTLLNEPAAIHAFMSTPLRREGPFLDVNRRVMGDGLLVTNDLASWRPRRLLIQRELSPRRVQIHEASIIERTMTAIQKWVRAGEVSMRDEIGRLALDNLGESVFGGDFGDFRDTVHLALELLVEVGDHMEAGTRDSEREALLEVQIVKLEDVVNDLVRQRHDPVAARAHVLDVLLAARDTEDPVFGDPFVRDEAITLMMAGHDTTAFLNNMATFLLSQHPEMRQRLRDEVLSARAAEVAPENLVGALPFAKLVASETLRLYPPLPFVHRIADTELDVDGVQISAGSVVTLSPWITHRDPQYFPDPLTFDPERFSEQRRGDVQRNTYFPFGLGQRVCAGNHFAMLETALMISLIAAEVDLDFASDTPHIDSPVTLRFAEPLTATVRTAR